MNAEKNVEVLKGNWKSNYTGQSFKYPFATASFQIHDQTRLFPPDSGKSYLPLKHQIFGLLAVSYAEESHGICM